MSQFRRLASVCLFIGSMNAAQAATVFSDDFNADATALNQTTFLGGWTVTDGTVDLVDFVFGRLVDLDGSTLDAGVFSKELALSVGNRYTASFQLAGSQRGSMEMVDVTFGTSAASYMLASGDVLSTRSLVFVPAASGTFALTFENAGGDNVGALLDNVSVVSALIPEPGAYALMLAGLGLVGLLRLRTMGRNAG